jgi:hypothetical protein
MMVRAFTVTIWRLTARVLGPAGDMASILLLRFLQLRAF